MERAMPFSIEVKGADDAARRGGDAPWSASRAAPARWSSEDAIRHVYALSSVAVLAAVGVGLVTWLQENPVRGAALQSDCSVCRADAAAGAAGCAAPAGNHPVACGLRLERLRHRVAPPAPRRPGPYREALVK
ncbi:MAG: hypothetical protein ACM3N5_03470 [Candidatus Eiseniibacteriota bacterium]